jgi:outer membrane protein TolC
MARAAVEDARIGAELLRGKEQQLVASIRRAYAEYWRAEAEYQVHLEHAALTQQMVDLARTQYGTGRNSQQDVLRLVVELSRLHTEMLAVDQDRRTARALLNALMARPADAALGPPGELRAPEKEIGLPELDASLLPELSEIRAAVHGVERSAARVEVAEKSAHWPGFMVGADYWNQPSTAPTNAYAAMFQMSLPWLNPRHADEVREAEYTLSADRAALESVQNTARYRLREAWARAHTAREVLAVIERDEIEQAKQSLEAAEALFASGRGDALGLLDALKSYLGVRLERARSRAALEAALAELDRAAGVDPRRALRLEANPWTTR